MKGHGPKAVPDRVLSGMILRTIAVGEEKGSLLTSQQIHDYVSTNAFYFESPDLDEYGKPLFAGEYTYDNLPGIRSSLSYLRRSGYLTKDSCERLARFGLTEEGRLHAADPFYKYKLKQQYLLKLAEEHANRILDNDEQVEHLAERKRIEKCKTCRDSKPRAQRPRTTRNTVRPIRNIIKFQKKNGEEIEIEFTDDGVVKELQDLKDALVMKEKDPDIPSTIMSLQNENEELKKVLKEAGIRIESLDTQLGKEKGRRALKDERTFIRNMDRMSLAHHYYENSMYLDAEFFAVWGGSLVVVEYKRTLDMQILSVYYDIQSTKGEIMTRTDYARRILEPDEIEAVEIQVIEIKGSSVVVDSEHFQAPKTMKV